MVSLLFLLALGYLTFRLLRGPLQRYAEMERGRAARNAEFHGLPAPDLRPRRDPYPARRPGMPRLHRSTLRFAILGEALALAFLVYVGIVGGSLIPVLLMTFPILIILGLVVRELERKARLLEVEVHDALASVGSRDEDWYVPENWL